ncbi:VRR-NUC domain-containing protein [Macrococcus brunensis]|uniref:VRR-NUC domain-containing protein n=1 Tax=Macrococcus brunensis TaxID=198483 RepID=UPI001EF04413|nr:VRR-NUC domain-containing protein [Macrococcus brunensis]ULG73188.1 VRR-NUC domain-containing protein [Macrococcus brunensis]
MSHTEKKIERQIIAYLESLDAWVFKVHGGSQFQRAGVPDIIACVNGRFVAVEVKRPKGGIVSPLQHENIDWINRTGGVALVATSIDEVEFDLKRYGVI